MPGHFFGPNRTLMGNVSNIVFQLLARFGTAVPATLPNPLVVDVGQLNLTDTGAKLSISGGQLVCSGVTTANVDPFIVSNSTYVRSPGLAFFWDFQVNSISTDGARAGLTTSNLGNTTYTHHIDYYNNIALPSLSNGGTPDGGGANTTGAMYRYGIILRGTGAFYLYQGPGAGTLWKVIYIENVGTTSPFYFKVVNRAITYLLDNLEVTTLKNVFATDFGFATTHLTNPAANTIFYMSSGDNFVELTYTRNAAESLNLYYRMDAAFQNGWAVTDNGSGICQLWKVTGGSNSSVAGNFSGTSANGTYRYVIRVEGNVHRVFRNDSLLTTYTDSSSSYMTQTGCKFTGTAANSPMSEIVTWPTSVNLPSGI